MFFNQPTPSTENNAPVPAQQSLVLLQQLLQALGIPADVLVQVLTGQLVPVSQLTAAQAKIIELDGALRQCQGNLRSCIDRMSLGIGRPPTG